MIIRYIVKPWNDPNKHITEWGIWDTYESVFIDVWKYKADAVAHTKRLNKAISSETIDNPLVSGTQQRLMYATVNDYDTGIEPSGARKMIEHTPRRTRQRLGREVNSSPNDRVYQVINNKTKQVLRTNLTYYEAMEIAKAYYENSTKGTFKVTRMKRLGNTSRNKARGNPAILEQVQEEVANLYDSVARRVKGSSADRAKHLAEKFHGRPAKEDIEVDEVETYNKHLAVLGQLEELQILCTDNKSVLPLHFKPKNMMGQDCEGYDYMVYVCANPDGTQIEFIGGDQEIDVANLPLDKLDLSEEEIKTKQLVYIGPVYSIAYFADKHHLTGPKQQADGTAYAHEFGEEGGTMPDLIYDTKNRKCLLTGGSYEVREEGIWN